MLKLFTADLKMVFRNRQYAFWAIMFPLMFTFIFGFFFGNKATTGTIILINQAETQVAENLEKSLIESKLFTIKTDVTDPAVAKTEVEKNKVAGAVIIPEKFGSMTPDSSRQIKIIIDPGNVTTNSVIEGFLDKFNTAATFQAAGIDKPAFEIVQEKTNTRNLNYFDFVFAGILGLALMNSSIIGISVSMTKYREDQILKRITTTPMKTWWFILGEVLSRLVMNFIQISVILSVGYFIFDAHIYGNVFLIYLIALIGAILFQLLGFAIASFVKTTEAAEGAATAITIPMMFLGGVFFPIDTLPRWLYSVVQYLPIAPLLRMIRATVLEGASLLANPTNAILIMSWVVVLLIVSVWRFRLTEE